MNFSNIANSLFFILSLLTFIYFFLTLVFLRKELKKDSNYLSSTIGNKKLKSLSRSIVLFFFLFVIYGISRNFIN